MALNYFLSVVCVNKTWCSCNDLELKKVQRKAVNTLHLSVLDGLQAV